MSEALEVTLGGKTYHMTPLTTGDMTKFDNRVKTERLQIVLDSMPPGSPGRAEIVREILNDDMMASARALGTVGGLSYLLYLSIVHQQPNLKYADFIQDIPLRELDNLDESMMDFAFGRSGGKEDGESPPVKSSPPASD